MHDELNYAKTRLKVVLSKLVPRSLLQILFRQYLRKLENAVEPQAALVALLELSKMVHEVRDSLTTRINNVSKLSTDYHYTDRHTKGEYIFRKYGSILGESVLDVGCDQAPMRPFFVNIGIQYVGVDISGTPDVWVNLDHGPLPFPDRAFHTVVCADVLEHLEQIHFTCNELCRVAKKYVIVSLPNNWYTFLASIFQHNQRLRKHYGLPLDKPVDRHRWFFGYSEAENFITEYAKRNGFNVLQLEPEWTGPFTDLESLPQTWKQALAGPDFSHGTIWCVLERIDL